MPLSKLKLSIRRMFEVTSRHFRFPLFKNLLKTAQRQTVALTCNDKHKKCLHFLQMLFLVTERNQNKTWGKGETMSRWRSAQMSSYSSWEELNTFDESMTTMRRRAKSIWENCTINKTIMNHRSHARNVCAPALYPCLF